MLANSQRQQSNVDIQKETSVLGGSGIKSVYTILRKIQKEKELQEKILKTEPQSQH